MKASPIVMIVLKVLLYCAMQALLLMEIGCRDEYKSASGTLPQRNEFVEQFRQKVSGLVGQIDSSEGHVYRCAHELFMEATNDEVAEHYEELVRIYVQAVKDLHFDVVQAAMGDEKENSRLDSRLRNLRSIAESAAATVLCRHAESIDGWNLLASIVVRYRQAAEAAGRAMSGLDHSNAEQRRQYRRYFLFKREMTAMAEVSTCTIGTMYERYRHRLTSEQRKTIIQETKALLGALPLEMEKDDNK